MRGICFFIRQAGTCLPRNCLNESRLAANGAPSLRFITDSYFLGWLAMIWSLILL
jgi:hypothetical protein